MPLTVYAVADGYDQIEASLVALNPQPALPEQIRFAELEFYGDGHADFNGYRNAELVWSPDLSTEDRNNVLSQLGLSDTVASNEITINLKLNDDTWDIMNAVAVYLQSENRTQLGKRDLRVALQRIEAV